MGIGIFDFQKSKNNQRYQDAGILDSGIFSRGDIAPILESIGNMRTPAYCFE